MTIPKYRDIVVVGGGPAGLAAAIAARRKGLSVAVLDPDRPPIEKACGEGLMPDGVEALERLGVRIENIESYRFRGIRFLSRDVEACAEFPTGFGLGIRRTAFHSALAAHAAATGVDLLWGIGATGLTPDGVLTSAGSVRCQWTIGADGGHSRTRAYGSTTLCQIFPFCRAACGMRALAHRNGAPLPPRAPSTGWRADGWR